MAVVRYPCGDSSSHFAQRRLTDSKPLTGLPRWCDLNLEELPEVYDEEIDRDFAYAGLSFVRGACCGSRVRQLVKYRAPTRMAWPPARSPLGQTRCALSNPHPDRVALRAKVSGNLPDHVFAEWQSTGSYHQQGSDTITVFGST